MKVFFVLCTLKSQLIFTKDLYKKGYAPLLAVGNLIWRSMGPPCRWRGLMPAIGGEYSTQAKCRVESEFTISFAIQLF
jgi:hypothetical protein